MARTWDTRVFQGDGQTRGGLTVVDLNVELLGLDLRVLVAHPKIAGNVTRDLALGHLARERAVQEAPRDALHQTNEEENL